MLHRRPILPIFTASNTSALELNYFLLIIAPWKNLAWRIAVDQHQLCWDYSGTTSL